MASAVLIGVVLSTAGSATAAPPERDRVQGRFTTLALSHESAGCASEGTAYECTRAALSVSVDPRGQDTLFVEVITFSVSDGGSTVLRDESGVLRSDLRLDLRRDLSAGELRPTTVTLESGCGDGGACQQRQVVVSASARPVGLVETVVDHHRSKEGRCTTRRANRFTSVAVEGSFQVDGVSFTGEGVANSSKMNSVTTCR